MAASFSDESTGWPGEVRSSRRAPIARPPRADHVLFSVVARCLLLALLVAAPWAFGGVQAWTQVWMHVVILAALACWWCSLRMDPPPDTVIPMAAIPLLLGIALGLFQLWPMTASWRMGLAPGAQRAHDQFSAGANEDDGGEQLRALSVAPAATRDQLALLTMGVAMFLLSARFFRQPSSIPWLLGVTALNGLAVAMFGLVQSVTWNEKLFWVIPLSHGGQPFGPFVNRNSAGGWLELSLAAALGLLWYALRRAHDSQPADRILYALEQQLGPSSWWSRVRLNVLRSLAALDTLTLFALTASVCIAAGILGSLSRGAVLSVAGAVLITAVAGTLLGRATVRFLSVAAILVAAVGMVTWMGIIPAVEGRLSGLLDTQSLLNEGRLHLWSDSLNAAGASLPFGAGLGTFRYITLPWSTINQPVWFQHAENQYLEALIDGGLPGLVLLLAAIALVFTAAIGLARNTFDPTAMPMGIVGVFALSAQAIHGCFDFGLYLPANMLLMAALCGAVCGRAALVALETGTPDRHWTMLPRKSLITAMLLLAMTLGMAASTREAWHIARIDAALDRFRSAIGPRVARERVLSTHNQLAAAARARWDDGFPHQRLAELQIQQYRMDAVNQILTEMEDPPDAEALWRLTALDYVLGRAAELERSGQTLDLERLRQHPAMLRHLPGAVDQLLWARSVNPFLAGVHLTLGELGWFDPARTDEAASLDRAAQLTPGRADILFRVGSIHWKRQRDEQALNAWRRSWAITNQFAPAIINEASERMPVPALLAAIAPTNAERVYQLAFVVGPTPLRPESLTELQRQLLEYTVLQLDRPQPDPAYGCYLRGVVATLLGDQLLALESYRQAVEAQPNNQQWRYELATMLLAADLPDEARIHARLGLAGGRSHAQRFEELLQQIYRHPNFNTSLQP